MRVLLATDGSQYAEEAAWLLSRLPHDETLELIVLTVIHIPYVPSPRPSNDWMSECLESEKSFAVRTYQEVAKMFEGADANVRHVVREGHLGQAIIDVAKEERADLIVMGAKGHSAIDRILLGSTSDYVATHAPCSVLVVRPTGLREESERPLRVAVAFDNSEPSQAALAEISEFKWGGQTTLEIVTVVSFISAFMNEIVIDPQEIKDTASQAIQEASERLSRAAPKIRTRLVESDHIGEGLVRHSVSHNFDLVVVGDTGLSGLSKALLGSVSRYVLRHVPGSVWISRRSKTGGTSPAAETSAAEAR